MTKEHVYTALIALAAYGVVAYVQKNVVEIPVVGSFLPK